MLFNILRHVFTLQQSALVHFQVVRTQHQDLRSAIAGQGDFKLSDPYKRFAVPIDMWANLNKIRRDAIVARFLGQPCPNNQKLVTSSDGQLAITGPGPNGGKKKGQKRRRKAERTR